MKKRNALILLIVLPLVFAMGCSLQNGGKGLKTGKYVMQDAVTEDWSWVMLEEDNQFKFNRCGALSHLPMGTYSVEDDTLILTVSEKEEYRFKIDGDKLIFLSGEMAEPFVKKGTVYKLSGKE